MSEAKKHPSTELPPSPSSTPKARRSTKRDNKATADVAGAKNSKSKQNDDDSSSFDSLPFSPSLVFLSSISREVESHLSTQVQRDWERNDRTPQSSNHGGNTLPAAGGGGNLFSTLAHLVTELIPTAASRCDDDIDNSPMSCSGSDHSFNLFDPDVDDEVHGPKLKNDKGEDEVLELGVDVGDVKHSEVFTSSKYLFDPDDDEYDTCDSQMKGQDCDVKGALVSKSQLTKSCIHKGGGTHHHPLDDSISTTDIEDSSYNNHHSGDDKEASSSIEGQCATMDMIVNPMTTVTSGMGRPRHPHALRRRPSIHEFKKYDTYSLKVEKYENDKATEIKFCNFQRPHMRAFYCAWFSFLIAYVNWFAIAPLLPEVRDSLDLSREEIWTSSIASIPLATVLRFTVGPLCDKYGARWVMMWILLLASIPTACTGFVQTGVGLSIVRLFSGIGGSAFVMTQFWANAMFSKRIVGTASAIVGNSVEVGVTQLFMGSVLFPLFQNILGENDNGVAGEKDTSNAWRYVTIVPAVMTFTTGIAVYFGSDDTPKGNYHDLKSSRLIGQGNASRSFRRGVVNSSAWLLFIQYACCMGLELTINSAAALYFTDEFGQSTATAAAIASIYGWVAPIGTCLGGYLSDFSNQHFGLHGRLFVQCCGCIVMGSFVLVFAQLHTMNSSIVFLAFTSIAQKAAVSFTFSIVPYVDPPRTGTIAGIVASGAGFGAICFGLVFRQLESYESAFLVIGWISVAVSVLTFFINIPGHEKLLSFRCKKRTPTTVVESAAMMMVHHDLEFPSDLPHVEDDEDEDCSIDGGINNENTCRSNKSTVQFDLSHRDDEGPTNIRLPFDKEIVDDGGDDGSSNTGDNSASSSCDKDPDESEYKKGVVKEEETAVVGSVHSDSNSSFDSSKISVKQVDNEDEFEVSTLVEI